MKRRDFLRTSAPFTVLPFMMNGTPLTALGNPKIMNTLSRAFVNTDHVLVLIQMNGGNDGLNTVIPVDQYSNLSKARSNIMIPISKVLVLDGVDDTGLHPAMTHMRGMFDNGKLQIVQNVGYPNPNYSHFRSTDIWNTASDSDEVLYSGWIGRYLSNEFPNFPDGFPNSDMPDPLALQVGSVVSTVCQGVSVNMGMAISNPTAYYALLTGNYTSSPSTHAGKELDYVRLVAEQSNAYGQAVKTAGEKGANKSSKYPTEGTNRLADQLKIVAQLISGGLKTRIYVVNINGFDTHANQVDATGGTENGSHATLLGWLSEAIDAFQDDLEQLGLDDRVMGMTYSEFGRRIVSNFSLGTDHGAAAPMFLFGKNVKGGIKGSNPSISSTVTVNDNLPMEFDFRSVYATLLKDWFCLEDTEVNSVMTKTHQQLDLLEDTCNTSSAQRAELRKSGNASVMNYPNPFVDQTTIRYESDGGHILIQIFNPQAQLIQTLVDDFIPEGEHEVIMDATNLAKGTYYYRYQRGSYSQTKPMIKVR
ncbi:MAG: DUF1501 domain-containing protein [Flavobacteriales bacterium]|nr:DUF1501 domain-containing protein [Bacteroidota bacterium]MCB9240091.1 DUF1501 domain-containing protein [Flavobacteriales bacterium]